MMSPRPFPCDAEHWFVAARSDQLGRQPLRRLVLGRPLVLFRDSAGRAAALEDRCPHRHVSLSLGRVVGDAIQCPYHGLCFDGAGRCVAHPCRGPGEALPAARVPSCAVIEQDGWIWVYPGSAPAPAAPPRYEKAAGYGWFELHNVMHAPMDLILENGVDCSHTGIVHTGLFRSLPSQIVSSRIERTPGGIRVETCGERSSGKLDAMFFAGRSAPIEHRDEFIAPHTVRVDYRAGKAHFITILVCTPETPSRTRVYTRQAVRLPPVTTLATLVSAVVTRRVVVQDKRILENQAEQMHVFKAPSRIATAADAPTRWLRRALYRTAPASDCAEEVQYKL